MKNPLVTVIIPSYNHGQYIKQAIESVLSQSYSNIEIIINDDGSTDNSHEIISQYKNIQNIHIILNKINRNQGVVLNESIAMSNGEYICILPSDDWFLKDKIKLQIEKFNIVNKNVGVIYGPGLKYYEKSGSFKKTGLPLYRGDIFEKMIINLNFIFPVTPLFRKECFNIVKFDENYKAEGEGLFIRLSQYYEFDFVEQNIAVMRSHSYNTGGNVSLMCSENLKWWNCFFNNPNLPVELRLHRNLVFSKLNKIYGLDTLFLLRDYKTARTLLFQSIKYYKYNIFNIKIIIAIIITLLNNNLSNSIIKLYQFVKKSSI